GSNKVETPAARNGGSLESRVRGQRDRFLRIFTEIDKTLQRAEELEGPSQLIAVDMANAVYQNAKLTREVAEIELNEYSESIFPEERTTAEQEKILAEKELDRASDGSAEQRLEQARAAVKAFEQSKPSGGLEALETILFADGVARAESLVES